MYELLTGENPFHALADQSLALSPEWDRSQFEQAVDRAILQSDPDLSLIVATEPADNEPPQGYEALSHSRNPSASNLHIAELRRRLLQRQGTSGVELPPVTIPDDGALKHPAAVSFASLAMAISPSAITRRLSSAHGSAITAAAGGHAPPTSNLHLARDLLQRLLCKDPTRRLGWSGAQEILQHDWFADIPWGALDTIPPPWRPVAEINMKSQTEMGEFSDEKESSRVKLDAQDQAHYEGWNFVCSTAFQDEVVEFLLYEEIKVCG